MDNLICTECGTTYYSAAAKAMVTRGERCGCGGLLREIAADDRLAVGAGAAGDIAARPAQSPRLLNGRRRFAREG